MPPHLITLTPRLTAILAVVALLWSVLPGDTSAGVLFLRDTNWTSDGAKRIDVGPAQRCYSFSCYSDTASFLKWSDMQTHSWLIFYKDDYCHGDFMKVAPSDVKTWPNSDFDNAISSFMVWESSIYPTRGLINVCIHREKFMVANHSLMLGSLSSDGSGSSEGVGDDQQNNCVVVGGTDDKNWSCK